MDGVWKIADVGISRTVIVGDASLMTQAGTPGYMAPEMSSGRQYGTSVDMFSLAITFVRHLNRVKITARIVWENKAPENAKGAQQLNRLTLALK